RHGAYEIHKLRADWRSTRSPATGLPGPKSAEALPMPANHWSLRSAAEQGKLLPERQVLEREVGAGFERRAQRAQHSEYEGHCSPWLARRSPIVQSRDRVLANDRGREAPLDRGPSTTETRIA